MLVLCNNERWYTSVIFPDLKYFQWNFRYETGNCFRMTIFKLLALLLIIIPSTFSIIFAIPHKLGMVITLDEFFLVNGFSFSCVFLLWGTVIMAPTCLFWTVLNLRSIEISQILKIKRKWTAIVTNFGSWFHRGNNKSIKG